MEVIAGKCGIGKTHAIGKVDYEYNAWDTKTLRDIMTGAKFMKRPLVNIWVDMIYIPPEELLRYKKRAVVFELHMDKYPKVTQVAKNYLKKLAGFVKIIEYSHTQLEEMFGQTLPKEIKTARHARWHIVFNGWMPERELPEVTERELIAKLGWDYPLFKAHPEYLEKMRLAIINHKLIKRGEKPIEVRRRIY